MSQMRYISLKMLQDQSYSFFCVCFKKKRDIYTLKDQRYSVHILHNNEFYIE